VHVDHVLITTGPTSRKPIRTTTTTTTTTIREAPVVTILDSATVPLRDRIAGIAAQLGEGWIGVPGDHPADQDAWLERPADGLRVHAHTSSWRRSDRGRIFLSGRLPEELIGGPRREITVSAARPFSAIAKEVKRRLLPDLEIDLAAALADKAESDARAATQSAHLAAIAAALGVGARIELGRHDLAAMIGGYGDQVTATFAVPAHHIHGVKVEIEVPPGELAVELAAAVARLREATTPSGHSRGRSVGARV
jgi:hypothetical protein